MSEEEGVVVKDGVLSGVDGDVRGHGLRRQEVPQGAKEDVAKVQFKSYFLYFITIFLFSFIGLPLPPFLWRASRSSACTGRKKT